MPDNQFEIQVKGRSKRVPSLCVGDKRIVVLGKWLRIARIHDEEWMEHDVVQDPDVFTNEIEHVHLNADIFTFTQMLPDARPRFAHPHEWDNLAVIPLTSYHDWLDKRVSRKTRQEITRSHRLGVSVSVVPYSDSLVHDITSLFNKTKVKQGKKFRHYGKDFAKVRQEISGFMDRCDFICARDGETLVGYIKLVYSKANASILNIVTSDHHYHQRPGNALLAKAVELSCEKGKQYLIYGKFVYGKKIHSTLTEFKRRNGFEKICVPRYYVPITNWGRIAMQFRLHVGMLGLLPSWVIVPLISIRTWVIRKITAA